MATTKEDRDIDDDKEVAKEVIRNQGQTYVIDWKEAEGKRVVAIKMGTHFRISCPKSRLYLGENIIKEKTW